MISLLTSTWTVENYMIFVWLGIFIIAILVEILTVELVSVLGKIKLCESRQIQNQKIWCQ